MCQRSGPLVLRDHQEEPKGAPPRCLYKTALAPVLRGPLEVRYHECLAGQVLLVHGGLDCTAEMDAAGCGRIHLEPELAPPNVGFESLMRPLCRSVLTYLG